MKSSHVANQEVTSKRSEVHEYFVHPSYIRTIEFMESIEEYYVARCIEAVRPEEAESHRSIARAIGQLVESLKDRNGKQSPVL